MPDGRVEILLRDRDRLLDVGHFFGRRSRLGRNSCRNLAAGVFEPELALGRLVVVPHQELVEVLLLVAVDGLVSQRVDVEVLRLGHARRPGLAVDLQVLDRTVASETVSPSLGHLVELELSKRTRLRYS